MQDPTDRFAFLTVRSSQIPAALADVRKVGLSDQKGSSAGSGFWPAMPHPVQDPSIFSRSHFLDHTFSITLGTSIAEAIGADGFQ